MFSHHSPSNTQEDLFDRAGHHSLVFSLTSSPRTATINDGNTNANKYTNTDKNNSKLGSLNGWYKNNNLQQPINTVAARSVFQSTQQPPAAINNDPGFQQQIVLGNAAQIAVDSTQQQQLQDRQPVSCQMMLTTLGHYELHTPSDLLMSSSVADCGGFTSPIPRSPLRPIVSALCNGTFDESANKSKKHSLAGSIKTPIARISAVKEARVCKTTTSISDTPYHSRKRNNLPDRAALPILADHILDMRLCSSPCYAQATNTTNPNTANVMQNDYNNDCQSSGEIHRLPHHFSPKDTIRRISPQTMVDLLDGQYAHCYDRLLVIDCRYPYEYLGGHIPGAVNVNRPDAIDQLLLENPPDSRSLHTCIVFHCEFSSQRAPRMALHVRNFDRLLNSERYPHLHYPEIYILDGGYKAFFDAHSERCDPPHQYLPMKNPHNKDDLRYHQKLKQSFRGHWAHSHISKRPAKHFKKSQSAITIDPARSFFKQLSESNLCCVNTNPTACLLDSANEFDMHSQDLQDLPSSIY